MMPMSGSSSMASHNQSQGMMQGNTTQQTNNMNSANMMMVFNTDNFQTMLFSANWMITSPAAYAGSWIFLFVLAIVWRAMHFIQHKFDDHAIMKLREMDDAHRSDSSLNTCPEKRRVSLHTSTWRPCVQLPRAVITTLTQGIAYLLMISVMTMNVGFFFAILLGFFTGEVAFARLGHSFRSGP